MCHSKARLNLLTLSPTSGQQSKPNKGEDSSSLFLLEIQLKFPNAQFEEGEKIRGKGDEWKNLPNDAVTFSCWRTGFGFQHPPLPHTQNNQYMGISRKSFKQQCVRVCPTGIGPILHGCTEWGGSTCTCFYKFLLVCNLTAGELHDMVAAELTMLQWPHCVNLWTKIQCQTGLESFSRTLWNEPLCCIYEWRLKTWVFKLSCALS